MSQVIHQVMARFRRQRMALRPISRIKHVVDFNGTLTANTNLETVLALAHDNPVTTSPNLVKLGSTINGIFLNVETASNETDAGAIPNVYLMVVKNPGGNLTFPNPNVVGSDDNKKYVIHQEMLMLNNVAGGNPRTLFKGVIAIPKGYRRMGVNDKISVFVFATALNIAVCVQCIYKEFN